MLYSPSGDVYKQPHHLPQQLHDVEGGASDADQPRETTPEGFWLFACSSETVLCQISIRVKAID